MRTLLFVPIIHMDVDLGSLANDVTKKGIRELGQDVWTTHRETVSGLWDSISGYLDGLEVSGYKIYQDGLVANGEMGLKIVAEGIKSGSKNYEIVNRLLQKGATLVKTEDFSLVLKERNALKQLTSKSYIERLAAYSKYILTKNGMLEKRDRFIASRINETLKDNETGIVFIGAYHNIIPLLDRDINVVEIKDVDKIREYQRALLHGSKRRERLEILSKYLVSPAGSV